jgi:hypothetical protein
MVENAFFLDVKNAKTQFKWSKKYWLFPVCFLLIGIKVWKSVKMVSKWSKILDRYLLFLISKMWKNAIKGYSQSKLQCVRSRTFCTSAISCLAIRECSWIFKCHRGIYFFLLLKSE